PQRRRRKGPVGRAHGRPGPLHPQGTLPTPSRIVKRRHRDPMTVNTPFRSVVDSDPAVFAVLTRAPGPGGRLPLTEDLLRHAPSGARLGGARAVGRAWTPAELGRAEVLVLSTAGGPRNPDGSPIALGFHTGHWEVSLLVKKAAEELRRLSCVPFAAF